MPFVSGTEHEEINRAANLAARDEKTRNSMERVRDMIEKVVEEIVGNVHDTPIDRLYNHSACKFHSYNLFANYRSRHLGSFFLVLYVFCYSYTLEEEGQNNFF